MNRFILKAGIAIILIYGGLILFRFMTLPDFREIEAKVGTSENSITSKKTYKEDILRDKINGIQFSDSIYSTYYFQYSFPYKRVALDSAISKNILRIINDSSSYKWGEPGTPVFTSAIVFYDKNDMPVGIVKIDTIGYLRTAPYLALTKWGWQTPAAFKALNSLLK